MVLYNPRYEIRIIGLYYLARRCTVRVCVFMFNYNIQQFLHD